MKREESKFLKPLENYFKSSSDCIFKTQVKVRSSIIDFLVFVQNNKNEISEVIGIEIKSDKDSFRRLTKQLSDYYGICNRVYIAVEDKEVPKDMPSFVGVFRLNNNKIEEERYAEIIKEPLESFKLNKTTVSNLTEEFSNLLVTIEKINNIQKKLVAFQITNDFKLINNYDKQIINFLTQGPLSIN